ncbi:DUF423 domain-containing protein [Reinekea sp. G2M2-21]|uniref:DUF423 domain-containing protein n=1 Tax=Reinekea sp. G2M2-21 TaxID=2788942 RepID=UPI0018A92905|nr:DUF423 domain-containing protein [Reinekea sp. G2M2-21]
MNRFALTAGALFCGLSVALGAFGAHAIADLVSAARLDTWHTASRYLMSHGLALLLFGTLSVIARTPFKRPVYLLFAGTSVFCASLFLLVILDTPWLGAIAPLGGVLMIAGWADSAFRLYYLTVTEN